jgi:hypothetical protein
MIWRCAGLLACGAALSACAVLGSGAVDESGPGVLRADERTPADAQALAVPGASKSRVDAALGRANVIRFDSGWEVWVYRWVGRDRSPQAATELVVLVDPQGTVKKSRVRRGDARP